MKLAKPNPDKTIQITVRDLTDNISKSKTVYDTTIEEVFAILFAAAEDAEDAAPVGAVLDKTA